MCDSLVSRVLFFFSSRRRHTRCLSDWSSDVCSSDLRDAAKALLQTQGLQVVEDVEPGSDAEQADAAPPPDVVLIDVCLDRSEERRVGKECRSLGSACAEEK